MNSIQTQFVAASDILKKYDIKIEKFNDRFHSLLSDMERYIEAANLKDNVFVNISVLGNMLIDYFVDVSRLKAFHPIDHLNSIKIVAYTSYWILKAKPIQAKSYDKEMITVNEKFVLLYILDFLSDENDNLLDRKEDSLLGFKETLLYFLQYRVHSPYCLELMLMSFFAGQVYQEPKMDSELPPNE